jgi:hypothetical protein
MFLRNVDWFSNDYMAFSPRRQNSLLSPMWEPQIILTYPSPQDWRIHLCPLQRLAMQWRKETRTPNNTEWLNVQSLPWQLNRNVTVDTRHAALYFWSSSLRSGQCLQWPTTAVLRYIFRSPCGLRYTRTSKCIAQVRGAECGSEIWHMASA